MAGICPLFNLHPKNKPMSGVHPSGNLACVNTIYNEFDIHLALYYIETSCDKLEYTVEGEAFAKMKIDHYPLLWNVKYIYLNILL